MLSIIFIGIALSMDAFSLALGLGTTGITRKQRFKLSTAVAIMHYIMPQLGLFFGDKLFRLLEINVDIVMIIVFFYLGISMFLKRKEERAIINHSILSYFTLAFFVSIDSFSVGACLPTITNNWLFPPIIFSVSAGIITYCGLLLGYHSIKLLKENATLLGSIILILLAIVNLFEHFF